MNQPIYNINNGVRIETVGIDEETMVLLNRILDQNQFILEMNNKLLESLSSPMAFVKDVK